MVGRGIVRRDVIRQRHLIIALLTHTGIQQNIIERLELQKGIYRVAQQHCARLRQAVVFIAHRIGAEQAGDLSTGGIAQDRVILCPYTKLLCMLSDILHGTGHILQRRIVGRFYADPVAQHEHRVAHFVQVPCRGNAFADFRADHNGISSDHQHIFLVRLCIFCRHIIQFYTIPAGILSDLFCRIERKSHLLSGIVCSDQVIQSICRILRRPVIGKAAQRLCIPVQPIQRTILVQ